MADACRPTTLDQFKIHYRAKMDLVEWFSKAVNSKDTHATGANLVVVSGPPGIGKTTLVELVCYAFRYTRYIFDTASFESLEQLVTKLGGLKFMVKDVKGRNFCIILDGGDSVSTDMAGAIARLVPSLHVPIVVICNNPYSPFPRTLTQRHKHVRLYPVADKDMFQLSLRMFEAARKPRETHESVGEIRHSDVKHIALSSMGDIRRCRHMTSLTLRATGGTDMKYQMSDRYMTNPFDVASVMLNPSTTLATRMATLENTDNPALATLFVFCNAPGDALGAISEWLSISDMFDRHDMPSHFSEIMGGAAAASTFIGATPKLEFPRQFFDMRNRTRTTQVLSAMRETGAGMRYSRRRGLLMDVHQHLTGKGYVTAAGATHQGAQQYADLVRVFGLDTFKDKTTSLLMLRKVYEREDIKRSKSETFKTADDDRHDALVLAEMLRSNPDDISQPAPKALVGKKRKVRGEGMERDEPLRHEQMAARTAAREEAQEKLTQTKLPSFFDKYKRR